MRKFIHVDMDAFFASVEVLDNPQLAGKPLVVGGQPEKRGVVASASYEAREFGVRSAMPTAKAVKLCPHLLIVPARFSRYEAVSKQVFSIFREYTDLVEAVSLDEGYLDVTENKKNIPLASQIAEEIRFRIHQETGLTASAGVSSQKFLAKIASDLNKPNGVAVIGPHRIQSFLLTLPVGKIPGVGKVTEKRLQDLGIKTADDLAQFPEEEITRLFGKWGIQMQEMARGNDRRQVVPFRIRKQMGREITFSQDLIEIDAIHKVLISICNELWNWLHEKQKQSRSASIKVRYQGFETVTRSFTYRRPFGSLDELCYAAFRLLQQTQAGERPIRLLGLSLSHLQSREPNHNETLLWTLD